MAWSCPLSAVMVALLACLDARTASSMMDGFARRRTPAPRAFAIVCFTDDVCTFVIIYFLANCGDSYIVIGYEECDKLLIGQRLGCNEVCVPNAGFACTNLNATYGTCIGINSFVFLFLWQACAVTAWWWAWRSATMGHSTGTAETDAMPPATGRRDTSATSQTRRAIVCSLLRFLLILFKIGPWIRNWILDSVYDLIWVGISFLVFIFSFVFGFGFEFGFGFWFLVLDFCSDLDLDRIDWFWFLFLFKIWIVISIWFRLTLSRILFIQLVCYGPWTNVIFNNSILAWAAILNQLGYDADWQSV
jgi:hypothetical protein